MAWSIKITEVQSPGLKDIRVKFDLLHDGIRHVADDVIVTKAELDAAGATTQLKQAMVKAKIDARAQIYIDVQVAASYLTAFIGTEYEL